MKEQEAETQERERELKEDAVAVVQTIGQYATAFASAPLMIQGILLWIVGDGLRQKELDVGDRVSLIGRGIFASQMAFFDSGALALITDTIAVGSAGVLITEGVTGKRVLTGSTGGIISYMEGNFFLDLNAVLTTNGDIAAAIGRLSDAQRREVLENAYKAWKWAGPIEKQTAIRDSLRSQLSQLITSSLG